MSGTGTRIWWPKTGFTQGLSQSHGIFVKVLKWNRFGADMAIFHLNGNTTHGFTEMAGSVMDAVVCEGAPGIVFIGFRLARRLSGKLPELKNDDESGLEKNIKKASPGTGLS
ncbi:hypothetical protein KUV44_08765 [Marinobacter daepoensis]|uniref:Uncharacterized protein n=1 Tax=Marinobacter daepoensis TaxID=262077 RepID=A0ABS3BAZ5_9GAMM|nr:hypothetical protein [Marinobacter daepoensis]MBY6079227.1 hypothetical protein [Marinobacter daepoensis]